MAPLTWREISAPNFQSAVSAVATAGQLMDKAGSGFINAIDSYQDGRTQSESSKLMAGIMGAKDPAAIQALISGEGGVDPRYLSPDALNFALKREAALNSTSLAYQRLAQAVAGRGRSGRGRGTGNGSKGGKADIVDNTGGGTGYIYPDGTVVDTAMPTAAAMAAIPTTVAPAQPKVAPVAAPVAEVADTPAIVPDAAAMPVTLVVEPAPVAVSAPTSEGTNAKPVAPLSVSALSPTNVNSVAPNVGPLRGPNKVKGNDGAAQQFPALTNDLGRMRIAAINGDLEAANIAAVTNPRILANLSGTNVLTTLDTNVKAVKPGVEAREALREEAEGNRNRARAENAYTETASFLPGTRNKEDALARVTTLDPRERAAQIADIEQADKQGYWNVPDIARLAADGSVILPSYLNDRGGNGGGGSVPVSAVVDQPVPAGTPAADAIEGAATNAQTAPQVVPYTGRNLDNKRLQSQRMLDQINLDIAGNPVRPLLADYEKLMSSTESANDVAAKLASEGTKETSGGIFRGKEVADVAGVINQYATQYKVTPAMAARAIENSVKPSTVFDGVKVWNSPSENVIDRENVDRLLSNFATSDGKPSPKILQEVERQRQSEQARSEVQDRMADLERATADLQKAENLKAAGRPVDLKAAQQTAKVAESNFDKAFEQLQKKESPAFQNRGPYPEQTATPKPVAGPANAAPAPAGRQSAIGRFFNGTSNTAMETPKPAATPKSTKQTKAELYQTLIAEYTAALGHEPTAAEFREIQDRATAEVVKRTQ